MDNGQCLRSSLFILLLYSHLVYAAWPKVLVASEGYDYQHLCEQNGEEV
jgi:hypothetical protein